MQKTLEEALRSGLLHEWATEHASEIQHDRGQRDCEVNYDDIEDLVEEWCGAEFVQGRGTYVKTSDQTVNSSQ